MARMGLCHKELPDRLLSSSDRKAQAQETGRAFLQVSCPAGASADSKLGPLAAVYGVSVQKFWKDTNIQSTALTEFHCSLLKISAPNASLTLLQILHCWEEDNDA